MLQFTLARDQLLVGYGFTGPKDPVCYDNKDVKQNLKGFRPSIFFAPRRDATSLITRKIHSVLILRNREVTGRDWQLAVLNFPHSEQINVTEWQKSFSASARNPWENIWINCSLESSSLLPDADISAQTYTLEKGLAPKELSQLRVSFESFIDANTLRERIRLEGISRSSVDVFVLNWHEPEIGAASLLHTTYADYAHSAVVSYRGKSWFTVQGLTENLPARAVFIQTGELQRPDSALQSLERVFQGISRPSDVVGQYYNKISPMAETHLNAIPSRTVAHGQTDGLIVWKWEQNADHFELNYSFETHMDLLFNKERDPFQKSLLAHKDLDKNWIAEQKPPSSKASQKIRDLYHRTLLILRQMQDPDGGIIAAPEFQFEFTQCGGYGYCWGRDAGFISYAMDMCGMHSESAIFYKYMAKCQSADGSFLHRHDMDSNLGASWGLLQPDETGSVLFGFWQHIKMSGNRSLAETLKAMVVQGAEWLCTSKYNTSDLPVSGFDLWEEREGIHLYSVAAMYAGIKASVDLSVYMGWDVPVTWKNRLKSLHTIVNSDLFQSSGASTEPSLTNSEIVFARTIKRRVSPDFALTLNPSLFELTTDERGITDTRLKSDYVLDVSQLGIQYPFQALDFEKNGSLYETQLQLISDKLWRPGIGGIGRYEGDNYRNGNPWILTTLWVALAASEAGKKDLAKKCFDWAIAHASPEGAFAEQIDPDTGAPVWVMPLTWSHAMFALAVQSLPEDLLK